MFGLKFGELGLFLDGLWRSRLRVGRVQIEFNLGF